MEIIEKYWIIIILIIVFGFEYLKYLKTKNKTETSFVKSLKEQKRKTFLDLWPDIWLIPVVTAVNLSLIWGLSILFPNAHFRGVETVQGVLIGLNSAFIVFTIAFLFIKLNFPRTWNWYKSIDIDESFNNLSNWQKYLTLLWVLSIVCFTATMAMLAQS